MLIDLIPLSWGLNSFGRTFTSCLVPRPTRPYRNKTKQKLFALSVLQDNVSNSKVDIYVFTKQLPLKVLIVGKSNNILIVFSNYKFYPQSRDKNPIKWVHTQNQKWQRSECQHITHNICSNNEMIWIRWQKFNCQCLRHSQAHILWEKTRKNRQVKDEKNIVKVLP